MRIDLVLGWIAVAVSLAAAVTDLTRQRIPNVLTYSTMVAAIAGRTVAQGGIGFRSALLGGVVGGGLFLFFFLLHAMGAGDVKLVAAIGCLVGPARIVEIALATAIVGGVLAIVYALWRRRLRATFSNVGELLRLRAAFGTAAHPSLNLSSSESLRLPYAVPIAVGVVYTICIRLR